MRPPAELAENGAYVEDLPDGTRRAQYVQVVGHYHHWDDGPHWEQYVWADEADQVLRDHITTCRFYNG